MALTKVQIDGVEFSDSTDLNVDNGTLVVDSTNNRVGVGTTSPENNLHIFTDTNGEGILVKSTGNSSNSLDFDANRTAAEGGIGAIRGKWNGTTVAQISFNTGSDTTNKDDGFISFGTESAASSGNANAAEKMRIDSSGRVGIGESTPEALLEIRGASTVGTKTGHILLSGDSATNGQGPQIVFSESGSGASYAGAYIGHTRTGSNSIGNLVFGVRTTTGDANTVPEEAMRIDEQKRVGIGTTSPSRKLVVSNAGAEGIEFGPGESSNVNLSLHFNRTSSAYITNEVRAADHTFYIGSSEKARIDSSGRLLVGTSTARSVFSGGNITTGVQVDGTSFPDSTLSITRGSNDNGTPALIFGKSRSTGNSITSSGDGIGLISFEGNDGAKFLRGAKIQADVDGTPGTNDMPGRLSFWTTADGASSPTERMRLNRNGYLYVSPNGSAADTNEHIIDNNQAGYNILQLRHESNSFSANGGGAFAIGVVRSSNSAYTLAGWYSGNGTSPFSDRKFRFRGDGNAYADGSWNGGGADYAEYFEWSDGNATAEDRRGISVVLDGDKIREAVEGEDPIGVISANPSVIGDADDAQWKNKYLRTEYGSFDLDENGDQKLNPAYDPDQEYVSREDRPEWDCVGLMGKLRIRKGQVTGARWIKMRDVSDNVEEWLVR